jgi:hypothetical protein
MPHSLVSSPSSSTENTNDDDVIEFNTADGIHLPHDEEEDSSPMRRRLLTLPVTDEFRVNSYTIGPQYYPAIGMQSNGNFVIAWYGQGQDGGGSDEVYAQCFNSNGALLGAPFQVNTYTAGTQSRPAIGVQSNGNFVIVWQDSGQDGISDDIYARHFNATGSPLTSDILVNTYTTSTQVNPAIGVQPNGDFIIAYASARPTINYLYAQRFNASASPLGTEFQVNTYIYQQASPAVGVQPDGNFIITYDSDMQDGSCFIFVIDRS